MGQTFCTCSDELDQPRTRLTQPLLRGQNTLSDVAGEIFANQKQKSSSQEGARISRKNVGVTTANGLASPKQLEESPGEYRRRLNRPPRIRKSSPPEPPQRERDSNLKKRGRHGGTTSANERQGVARGGGEGESYTQSWTRIDAESEDETSLITGPASPKQPTRPYRVNQMTLPPQMLDSQHSQTDDRDTDTPEHSSVSDPGSNVVISAKYKTPSTPAGNRATTPGNQGVGCPDPVPVHVANLPFTLVDDQSIKTQLEEGCGVRISKIDLVLRKGGRKSLGHATVYAASLWEAEAMKAASEKVFIRASEDDPQPRPARIEALKPKEPVKRKSAGLGRRGRKRQKKQYTSYYDQINC